jgi:hypothetical protein
MGRHNIGKNYFKARATVSARTTHTHTVWMTRVGQATPPTVRTANKRNTGTTSGMEFHGRQGWWNDKVGIFFLTFRGRGARQRTRMEGQRRSPRPAAACLLQKDDDDGDLYFCVCVFLNGGSVVVVVVVVVRHEWW